MYAEGLHRGHAMLLIRCTAGEHDRVQQLIEQHQPLDIDEHGGRRAILLHHQPEEVPIGGARQIAKLLVLLESGHAERGRR